MGMIPFRRDQELYRNLWISDNGQLHRYKGNASPSGGVALKEPSLPGQPNISLYDTQMASFLGNELLPRRLDSIGRHLWLIAKQDSTHISSLTHQLVRGRKIVVTENPELHLVWFYDQVFVKPLPKYLLSYTFWQYYLDNKASAIHNEQERYAVLQAARGMLRSYSYLIQHKSDFLLATDGRHQLLPRKLRYAEFIRFITVCQSAITDADVSPRYRFGELRLTRLNFWSKILLHQVNFSKVHGQYGARFAQYYGPILFVFGGLSVMLSAMQVALAAQPLLYKGNAKHVFVQVCWGFSIWAMVLAVILMGLLLFVFCFLVFRETIYAVRDLARKAKGIGIQ